MKYSVGIVKPPEYAHWKAFEEVCESFSRCLSELDASTPLLDGTQIVFGSHLTPNYYIDNPYKNILFNTEVPGSPWFTKEYIEALKTHEVWDYSAQNICRLWEDYQIEAKHCPIGYHECLEKIDQHTEKDIDVLFYGSMTERRKPIWEKVLATGLNCRHLFGVYGSVRDAYIARSKCVLDMAAYDNSPRNDFRLSYLWANKVPVVDGEKTKWEEVDKTDFVNCINKAAITTATLDYDGFKERPQLTAIKRLIL